MKRLALSTGILAALLTTGCLQKETISTVYLRQDGSLDWVVFERNIRSDESDATKRAAEETGFLEAVAGDAHGAAEGFRALGGVNTRTRLLRDTRPYAVMIDGQFSSLGELASRALTACGVPHLVSQTQEGDVTTWRLWADIGQDGEEATGNESDECGAAVSGLSDALALTIVLESGTFTEAVGFTLENGDTATVDEAAMSGDAVRANHGQMVLSLSWKGAGPAS